MSHRFDSLVIGGGIVGLSAAIAMKHRGLDIAVLDDGPVEAPETTLNDRVYAINQASQNLLEALGVWQHIQDTERPAYQRMFVWDAINQAHIEFDARLIAAPRLGAMLQDSVLKRALLKQANDAGILLLKNHSVNQIQTYDEGVTVFCAGEMASYQANFLMIADGARSKSRTLLDVPLITWPYHHHALVASVAHEKPHHKTAYQVFQPDGPLAFLPLQDPHQSSIVWSTKPEHAEQLYAMDANDFEQKLTQAFESKLGVTKLLSKRFQFPLVMRHVKQYSGKRWLLLGDVAHTIHPLAGLGLNLGLEDLATYLDLLKQQNASYCSEKLLGAYQRNRKANLWQMILLMEGLKRVFGSQKPPLRTLRKLGLQACQNLHPLKRFFIQQATKGR